MRVLTVDGDYYISKLDRTLRKQGGEVVHSRMRDVLRTLEIAPIDHVIIDVESLDSGSTPDAGFALCKDILSSDWGQRHRAVVYSRMSHADFAEGCRMSGIDPTRIDFYSKSEMEIPPVLKCIERLIIHDPMLIRMESFPPPAITADWIMRHPSPFGPMAQYCGQWIFEKSEEDFFENAPRGLQTILRLCEWEGEVLNGGFYQFMAHCTGDDGKDLCVESTLSAARELGLSNVAQLIEKARQIWQQDQENEAAFESLYDAFDELDRTWVDTLNRYIKDHPEMFVHP